MTRTSRASVGIRASRPLWIARLVWESAPAVLLAVSAAVAVAYFFTFLRPVAEQLDGVLPVDPADPTVVMVWGQA